MEQQQRLFGYGREEKQLVSKAEEEWFTDAAACVVVALRVHSLVFIFGLWMVAYLWKDSIDLLTI